MTDWGAYPLVIFLCALAVGVVLFPKPDHKASDLESQLSFHKELVVGLQNQLAAQQRLIDAQKHLIAERAKLLAALQSRCGIPADNDGGI